MADKIDLKVREIMRDEPTLWLMSDPYQAPILALHPANTDCYSFPCPARKKYMILQRDLEVAWVWTVSSGVLYLLSLSSNLFGVIDFGKLIPAGLLIITILLSFLSKHLSQKASGSYTELPEQYRIPREIAVLKDLYWAVEKLSEKAKTRAAQLMWLGLELHTHIEHISEDKDEMLLENKDTKLISNYLEVSSFKLIALIQQAEKLYDDLSFPNSQNPSEEEVIKSIDEMMTQAFY